MRICTCEEDGAHTYSSATQIPPLRELVCACARARVSMFARFLSRRHQAHSANALDSPNKSTPHSPHVHLHRERGLVRALCRAESLPSRPRSSPLTIKRRSTSRLSPAVCVPPSRFARRSRDVERVIAIIEGTNELYKFRSWSILDPRVGVQNPGETDV